MNETGGQNGEQQRTAAGAPGLGNQAAGRSDGQGTGGFSSPPAINLPKGGGAIRGMGEKFAANPVTGTGSMTVPLATSPGRSGFGPQLLLSYDSGTGNGPFGFGWSLSLPSITRKTDKGLPQYRDAEESDVFILSGAEDLVPLADADQPDEPRTVGDVDFQVRRYRPRIEGLFARIERWTNEEDPADVFWRSISKDNITTWYGKTDESRIYDPEDPSRVHVFSWLICESYDDKGNVIAYRYKAEGSGNVERSQVQERNRTERTRSSNRYLKGIRYGNRKPYLPELSENQPWPAPPGATALNGSTDWYFEAVLDYGEHDPEVPTPGDTGVWSCRNDPFSSYRAGFEVRTYRICQRVLMFHHFEDEEGVGNDCLVRSTDFTYSHEQNPDDARNPVYTFLLSATQSGYKRDGEGYLKRSLPPVEFQYTEPVVQDKVEEVDAESVENLPVGLDGTTYQWTDLHGEGIPGILTDQGGAWFYKRNLSPINEVEDNGVGRTEAKFAPVELVAEKPNLSLNGGQSQFMDLAGDGQPDLVVMDGPTPGLYEHDGDEGWQPFRPFTSRLNRDSRDPNLKLVDLDGDGHADVLITEDEALVWHPSLAEEGFGPAERVHQALDEEQGPRLVFADGTDSIYLADLSGDGLTDLARIRNGEVCYWPNLGYGRFGAKVTMDHAPHFDHPDQFDQKRIRLADIDGSGTTDIIYLHRDRVRLYFNQSGNSWSAGQQLKAFPDVDNLITVTAADLLGNGTACLVWSSPLTNDAGRPMRYVELMGGRKPHLLIKTINNLGAETRVQYASSTKFYLQDKRDGKPWVTRLPFPVHVVERVETYDHISRNRFVTRYRYHHGYFDGEEREFRGFGMVEQFDTEEFAALAAGGELSDATNLDEASHVPPVLTKTWFHTGAYLGRDQISRRCAREYYGAPEPGEPDYEDKLTDFIATELLPDTVLPGGMTLQEDREACRALKGSMLRQEVYALDETDREVHPYTVTEQNFAIRRLQPNDGNRHAVFFTHPHEAISYHYERNPADPRVQHALTLEVDEFGHVLKEATIGYGRRQPDPALQPADQEKQAQMLMTCAENSYTNSVEEEDSYRTPLPSETRTYELTGLGLALDQVRFSFVEVEEAVQLAEPIAYHEEPDDGLQKRLLEHTRTLYRPDDLGAAEDDSLALLLLNTSEPTLEPLALPGESYQLAFTPEHLGLIFGDRVTQSMLGDEGRYVRFDGDDNWWIPSGRVYMSPDGDDDAAQELDFARQHFFLPHRFRNPFGETSFVEYDDYDLLPLETRDPLDNRVTAGERDEAGSVSPRIDYRVLQPELMTDPNGNRSEVAFDILGMVVGTAVMGKPSSVPETVEGDSLDGFAPDLTQDQIDTFFEEDPKGQALNLLGDATTRVVYDLHRYMGTAEADDPQPAFSATVARETHASDPVPEGGLKTQVGFSYSDGFGREIQQKVQAEPETPDGPLRWVGSGWTIFNNKGKPVRQYEPFFSPLAPEERHRFEFGVEEGVSPLLFYDPAGRVVATLHPNHTWEKVVFDPWRQESWDVNDTVLEADPADDPDVGDFFSRLAEEEYLPTWHAQRASGSLGTAEQDAADKAADHAGTPAVTHSDSLGRPFLSIAHNGPDEQYETRTEQNIEENPLRVIDDRGNVVMAYQIELSGGPPILGYDVGGRQLYENSMDAGERWMLPDIGGKPIRSWDSRGHILRSEYDRLRRLVGQYVQGTDTDRSDPRTLGGELLFEKVEYGEGQENDTSLNLRTRVFRSYDSAGIVTSLGQNPLTGRDEAYDFKGNLLRSSRQLAADYKSVPDWSEDVTLEEEIFTSSTTYDALNRPVSATTPDSSETVRAYNEAGLLESVEVNLRGEQEGGEPVWTPFVTNIDYDAKGQRTLIRYGNGVETRYRYDPETFRLVHLYTRRGAAFTEDCGSEGSPLFAAPEEPPQDQPCGLQSLHYAYDPVGNITSIRDNAQQTVFFTNTLVEPHNDYTYDPLYRLIRAEGREHAVQNNIKRDATDFDPLIGIPFPNSPEALQRYVEEYAYDGVGNILSMAHSGGSVLRWKRCYEYAQDSNRLLATGRAGELNPNDPCPSSYVATPTLSQRYEYDDHGNMARMPHLPLLRWDFKDQLQASSRQVVNSGTPETTYYAYDSGGQRVRKVTESQAAEGETPSRRNERIHIGGFEVYREYNGDGSTVTLERETMHVMDDKQRIAQIDTRTQGNDDAPSQSQRFQLNNHLGSATLEVDQQANAISYEEYHPYGTSAYRAGHSNAEGSLKRYRYTGKERDEETSLYYHGARYYACWLGRWTTVDPVGLAEGINQYEYVSNSPVKSIDTNGLAETDTSNVDVTRLHPSNSRLNSHVNAHLRKIRKELKIEKGVEPTKEQRREYVRRVSSLGLPRGGGDPITTPAAIVLRTAHFNKTYIEKWAHKNLPTKEAGNKYQGASMGLHGLAWWTGDEAVNPSIVIDVTDPSKLPEATFVDGRLTVRPLSPDQQDRLAIGTDKLGHFFAQGYQLFELSVIEAKGDESVHKQNLEWESGKYGLGTTGVFSNADNEANLAGLQFYKDLYANPFMTFDIADYVTPEWNEEMNPNQYTDSVADLIYKNNPDLLTDSQKQQAQGYREKTRQRIESLNKVFLRPGPM